MNRIILSGKVGKDVQFREGKVSVAGFSFATSEYVKNGDTYTEDTEWHTVKTFGKLAEKIKSYTKGDYLEIEGKIKTNKYKNKEGIDVSIKEVIADRITRVRKAEVKTAPAAPQKSTDISQEIYNNTDSSGDLPF